MLPTQPLPRKAEDFLRGGKYFNHVPNLLPTKRYFLVGSIYVSGAATEYYINLSVVLKSLYQNALYILLDAFFVRQAIEPFSNLLFITIYIYDCIIISNA